MSSYILGFIRTCFTSVESKSGIICIRTSTFHVIKFDRFELNTNLVASSTEQVEFSKGSLIVDLDVKLHLCRIESINYVNAFSVYSNSTVVSLCHEMSSSKLSLNKTFP